jgi:hypothetical protein
MCSQGGAAEEGPAAQDPHLGEGAYDRRASAVGDNMGGQADQQQQQQRQHHRLPVHRRSSAAARNSMAGGMLSRLSLGLTDALQWLGIRGSLPAAAQPSEADRAAGDSQGMRATVAVQPLPAWGRDGGGEQVMAMQACCSCSTSAAQPGPNVFAEQIMLLLLLCCYYCLAHRWLWLLEANCGLTLILQICRLSLRSWSR